MVGWRIIRDGGGGRGAGDEVNEGWGYMSPCPLGVSVNILPEGHVCIWDKAPRIKNKLTLALFQI
jgi:hypothetical protein